MTLTMTRATIGYRLEQEGSPDAAFLRKKGVSGGTLECTLVITHPEKYVLRGDSASAASAASAAASPTAAKGAKGAMGGKEEEGFGGGGSGSMRKRDQAAAAGKSVGDAVSGAAGATMEAIGAIAGGASGASGAKGGANLSKRVRTYLVANSKAKREYWVKNLQAHCITSSKVNKLL